MVSDGFPPHNNDGPKSLKNKQKSWNKKEREREKYENQLYIEQQMADTNRPLWWYFCNNARKKKSNFTFERI